MDYRQRTGFRQNGIMPLQSLEFYGFVLVVLVVLGGYAVGTQFNVHRGSKVLAWLQQGLKVLGPRTSCRWLGSSVVELKLQAAEEPFQRAEIVAVLEPRDVAVLWWFHHVRGRRDLLIFRGQLRTTPTFEFEVLDPKGWSTRGIEQQVRFRNWNPVSLPEHSGLVAYAAGQAPPAAELMRMVATPECPVVRLAIRRTEPNLEVHWKLADAQQIPAQQLLERLQRTPRLLAQLTGRTGSNG
jgi:hypothetical protein